MLRLQQVLQRRASLCVARATLSSATTSSGVGVQTAIKTYALEVINEVGIEFEQVLEKVQLTPAVTERSQKFDGLAKHAVHKLVRNHRDSGRMLSEGTELADVVFEKAVEKLLDDGATAGLRQFVVDVEALREDYATRRGAKEQEGYARGRAALSALADALCAVFKKLLTSAKDKADKRAEKAQEHAHSQSMTTMLSAALAGAGRGQGGNATGGNADGGNVGGRGGGGRGGGRGGGG